jgi:phosphoglycolate phosphatase
MESTKKIDFSVIKLFIFDLDGTILPLHKRFYAVWIDTLTKFRLPSLSWNEFMKRIENDTLMETIDLSHQKSFMKSFLSSYSQYGSCNDTLIPGAKEILTQLKKAGFLLALATGRISSTTELMNEMKSHNLSDLFNIMTAQKAENVNSNSLVSKENQIIHILTNLNISADEAIMVGDYLTDIRSGKAMGLKTIALLSSKVSVEIIKKENPDLILDSINDLSKVIFG